MVRSSCTEVLPRETDRRGGAGGPIIFTDGFDECRNGGGECAARNGGERDLPNHLGLRDEDERKQDAWRSAGYEVKRLPSDTIYRSPAELIAICAS